MTGSLISAMQTAAAPSSQERWDLTFHLIKNQQNLDHGAQPVHVVHSGELWDVVLVPLALSYWNQRMFLSPFWATRETHYCPDVKRGSVGRHLFRNILMIVYLLYSTMTICVIHYQVKGPSLRRPDHLKSWSLPLQLQFFSSVLKYLQNGGNQDGSGCVIVQGVCEERWHRLTVIREMFCVGRSLEEYITVAFYKLNSSLLWTQQMKLRSLNWCEARNVKGRNLCKYNQNYLQG